MGWKPPKGAQAREASLSEYWKPESKGDTVMGLVTHFGESQFGPFMTLAPVLLWKAADEKPQGFGSINVGVNTWLSKIVTADVKGDIVAVRYLGKKDTPQGKMRCYDVYDVVEKEFRSLLAEHAPDLGQDAEDDEAPF